jgi:hypothetical protein
MKRKLVIAGIIIIAGTAIWLMTSKPEAIPAEQLWACNADAMLCPDGSSVGRTGPKCEFQACPSPDATFARIETYLGGRDGGLNLILKPREVISDSRCAPDAQCVWAGTVEVRTELETKVAHGELVFKLGEPRTVGDLTVTLVEVRPSTAEEAKDPEHGYWFVFEAKKK